MGEDSDTTTSTLDHHGFLPDHNYVTEGKTASRNANANVPGWRHAAVPGCRSVCVFCVNTSLFGNTSSVQLPNLPSTQHGSVFRQSFRRSNAD